MGAEAQAIAKRNRIDLSFYNEQSNEYQLTMPSSPGWSAYADVTNDLKSPPWTWAKIQSLVYGLYVEYDKSGKGNTMRCAKVEIRVTYTPVGPEKVTQYLNGNDCPTFPHGMDLDSGKLPCPPPYD